MQHAATQLRPDWSAAQLVPIGCALGSAGLTLVLCRGIDQAGAALLLMMLLGVVALLHPRAAVLAAFGYLAVMGDLRRLVLPEVRTSAWDPMILIGPAVAVLLAATALYSGALRAKSTISRLMLVLMALMTAQVFNPSQGGIAVGVAGALFYLVPMLWFWVGQWLGSEAFLEQLFRRLVIPCAAVASALGIYQAFFGLLPYQERWVQLAGYASLYLAAGLVRPFSFFTSSAEFGHYVSVATALVVAGVFFRRVGLAAILAPLMVMAVFLQGSRSIFVTIPAAAAVLWSVQGRSVSAWGSRLIFAGGGCVLVLIVLLAALPASGSGSRVAPILQHQVGGLLNPLDPQRSSARVHGEMVIEGITGSISSPLGHGLGATTMAATKFGGRGGSTELDISNLFVSLGLPGGLLYVALVITVLRRAALYWRRSGGWVALCVLGMLVAELGNWLIGGHYAVVALLWFCIGALDRLSGAEVAAESPAAESPQGMSRSLRPALATARA